MKFGALVARFARDERGATAIEYGLIAFLVSIAAIGTMQAIGVSVSGLFTEAGTDVQNVEAGMGT